MVTSNCLPIESLYYILRIQRLKYSIYLKRKSNILKVIKFWYYIQDAVCHLMLCSLMELQALNSETNTKFIFIFYTIFCMQPATVL
jgi:hypothetical protein